VIMCKGVLASLNLLSVDEISVASETKVLN
jgi:hypothetical protein